MTQTMTAALAERARLGVTLALFATSRGIEAAGSGDRRYTYAADAIKRIAGTLDQVGMKSDEARDRSPRRFSSHSSSRLARYGTVLASAFSRGSGAGIWGAACWDAPIEGPAWSCGFVSLGAGALGEHAAAERTSASRVLRITHSL